MILILHHPSTYWFLNENPWEFYQPTSGKRDINSWDPKKWDILGDHWSEISLICFALLVDMDILQWDGKPWFLWSHFRLSHQGHVFFYTSTIRCRCRCLRLFCVFISIPGLVMVDMFRRSEFVQQLPGLSHPPSTDGTPVVGKMPAPNNCFVEVEMCADSAHKNPWFWLISLAPKNKPQTRKKHGYLRLGATVLQVNLIVFHSQ